MQFDRYGQGRSPGSMNEMLWGMVRMVRMVEEEGGEEENLVWGHT